MNLQDELKALKERIAELDEGYMCEECYLEEVENKQEELA